MVKINHKIKKSKKQKRKKNKKPKKQKNQKNQNFQKFINSQIQNSENSSILDWAKSSPIICDSIQQALQHKQKEHTQGLLV
jgi:hypothetical protein